MEPSPPTNRATKRTAEQLAPSDRSPQRRRTTTTTTSLDESPSPPPPPPPNSSSVILPNPPPLPPTTLQAIATLSQYSERLRWRSHADEQGQVTLSSSEVVELSETIESTVQGFLQRPATTEDLLLLVQSLSRVLPTTPHQVEEGGKFITGTPSRRRRKKASIHLPEDIISLILEQLRDCHTKEVDEGWTGHSGRHAGWRELRNMALVSKAFRAVALPAYLRELHIGDARSFPKRSKQLQKNPTLATALTRLHIRVYDFEFSLTRNTDDAGFALPTLIRLAPNLTTFTLESDRLSHSSYRRRREATSFETFTGGIHIPSLIVESLPLLRILKYGAPTSLSDIALFTTQLPNLIELDVAGDVDLTPPPSVFKSCVQTLRRLWIPTAALSVSQLHRLISSSRIKALAFTFDLDRVNEAQAPTEEQTNKSVKRLMTLFERVGPQLKELLVTSPFADAPEPGMRFRGLAGANAAQQLITVLTMGGAPPPPQPQAGGAAPVAAPNLPPGLFQAAPAPPPANVAPAPAPAPTPIPTRRRAAGNPAAAAPPPPQPNPPPVANANAPANLNAPPPPFMGFFPMPPNLLNAPTIYTPFFESILPLCPSLYHLELYGRRYSSTLITDLLPSLNNKLEHLSLSVPNGEDEGRKAVVDALEGWLMEGGGGEGEGKAVRSVSLSGRGGEWEASERRRIKEICELRDVGYSSTDMRN